MSDRSRQRLRTTLTILVTALLVAPAAALATHGFNDVDDGDFYHAAVDWMKANGVTVGCNPPDNTEYCPDDPVTRGEMAVFLERLDSKNVFVRPGDDAVDGGNADTVDGMHASDFLGATDKAVAAQQADVGLSPVAYATVLSDGILVTNRSRGVDASDVTLELISSYCFRDLDFSFTTAQATPIYEGGTAVDVEAMVGLPGLGFGVGSCSGSDAQLAIATVEDSNYARHGFIVWFYN